MRVAVPANRSPNSVADAPAGAYKAPIPSIELSGAAEVAWAARNTLLLALVVCSGVAGEWALVAWWPVVLCSCSLHWILLLHKPRRDPVLLAQALTKGGWLVVMLLRLTIAGEPLPTLE